MKLIIQIILFSIISIGLHAQTGTLKWKIINSSNNEAVPFATIVVNGTQIASTSDLDGNFIFTGLTPGYIQLKVSYIGFNEKISQDVLVSNNNIPFIEIKLEPSDFSINEVVVNVDKFIKKEESPLSMQTIGIKEIESNCYKAMNDDFNSPILVAHLFEAVRIINLVKDEKESIALSNILRPLCWGTKTPC